MKHFRITITGSVAIVVSARNKEDAEECIEDIRYGDFEFIESETKEITEGLEREKKHSARVFKVTADERLATK